MTVFEYNKEFLPKIEHAQCFISRVELAIDHMGIGECGRNEVRRILGLYCWDKDTEKTILTALEYYRIHEGIEKLVVNAGEAIKPSLSERLKEIDRIEDDQEFMMAEYSAVRDYCKEHNFKLDIGDMYTIITRGLLDSYSVWVTDKFIEEKIR